MKNIGNFRPAVPNKVLLLLAGTIWLSVGFMLSFLAYGWISFTSRISFSEHIIIGVIAAILIHHFGFSKIAAKNRDRIINLNEKGCLFSFFTLKSYLIILIMIFMGYALRHSVIPKHFLAVLYIGIGLALILSSNIYFETIYGKANGT